MASDPFILNWPFDVPMFDVPLRENHPMPDKGRDKVRDKDWGSPLLGPEYPHTLKPEVNNRKKGNAPESLAKAGGVPPPAFAEEGLPENEPERAGPERENGSRGGQGRVWAV
ncbi:MAG: hypothetical protein K9N49_05140, partial [Candidatus Marinimicrobia bacterium]|nr:hypothetical protein [Candidatus Neomarinimicrobiota bacterium]